MKKIDTHVHTSEVSTCGKMTAAEMVDAYRRAGYDAIVITDHLILEKIQPQQLKPYEIVEQQLRGYLAAVAAAKGDIDVLLGAEIRFTSGHEDYLLLGLDEQKYFELARALPDSPEECRALTESMGGLMYQAHPFRPGLRPAAPAALSGVEVYNGSTSHDSRNDIALMWAERHGLIKTSGSDSHNVELGLISGGIVTDEPIRTNSELLDILRTGRYTMLGDPAVLPTELVGSGGQ